MEFHCNLGRMVKEVSNVTVSERVTRDAYTKNASPVFVNTEATTKALTVKS